MKVLGYYSLKKLITLQGIGIIPQARCRDSTHTFTKGYRFFSRGDCFDYSQEYGFGANTDPPGVKAFGNL